MSPGHFHNYIGSGGKTHLMAFVLDGQVLSKLGKKHVMKGMANFIKSDAATLRRATVFFIEVKGLEGCNFA